MKKIRIEPREYYSATAVTTMKIPGFPWKSAYTFTQKLNDPRWFKTFKPLTEQHESKKTYMVQGKNIIRFLTDLEKGRIKI